MIKSWLKILAVMVFLVAVALLAYSLAPVTSAVDTTPIAPVLLLPPGGAP